MPDPDLDRIIADLQRRRAELDEMIRRMEEQRDIERSETSEPEQRGEI